ncbi:hypothetical protein TH60_07745 [Pantoea ananatis]|uniref:EAL domain-containing protein n=1 Tax=Pantoea ananas TaxID=553 RepID=UPI000E27E3A0|nr:EAL domain-containing protein [Pantoea ananatis]MDC7869397.1 hypothetical protein [Pantoea ananatis]PKC44447.1 hypothetical protein V461_10240 [Pantoea ananatis BRT98]REE78261.1 EAL domain-containing protein (putative c-di-GMP-specific phosphodiesterase class I) [Pantoea ananatis]BBL31578.1 EAL domain-containing protein [Pantoea ananatis]
MLSVIQGIRLQPIVRLDNNNVFGYEILSLLPSNTDVECFFQKLPTSLFVTLLEKQLMSIRRLTLSGLLFINIPVAVLLNMELSDITFFRHPDNRIVIEVQDAQHVGEMTVKRIAKLKESIKRLQHLGWSVWLDDYRTDMATWLTLAEFNFNGIKTDYHEMQKCRKNGTPIKPLVESAKRFSQNVLIEGIETAQDLYRAIDSGAALGQGFLWPESTVS